MDDDKMQAEKVIYALRSFRDEIRFIINSLEGKRTVTQEEKEELQDLLKKLKERIKKAAKTGTVSGLSIPPNRLERAYFTPALSKASAHFYLKTNSHPIKGNWISELCSVEIDITHQLFDLEQQFLNV